jgi:chitin disaccharide deacetylase
VLWLRKLDDELSEGYPDLAAKLDRAVAEMNHRKLPVLDNLLQFYGGDDLVKREKTYRDAIKNLPPGLTQLIIHSSVDGQELAAITSSHLRRNQDFELFSQPKMREWIEGQGIELTSWKELTQEARK